MAWTSLVGSYRLVGWSRGPGFWLNRVGDVGECFVNALSKMHPGSMHLTRSRSSHTAEHIPVAELLLGRMNEIGAHGFLAFRKVAGEKRPAGAREDRQ